MTTAAVVPFDAGQTPGQHLNNCRGTRANSNRQLLDGGEKVKENPGMSDPRHIKRLNTSNT